MMDEPEYDTDWLQRLGKVTGHHRESMLSVAEGITIELPDLTARLDQAIEAGNAADVRRLGHTLKSSLRYISEGDEVEKAANLERAGAENRLDDAARLVEELRPVVASWCATIQDWIGASE